MNEENLTIRRGTSLERDARRAARELHAAIWQPDMSFGVFFCAPDYDLDALGDELNRLFPEKPLIGCTTAGEITPIGYLEGSLTGVTIASSQMAAVSRFIPNVQTFEVMEGPKIIDEIVRELSEVTQETTPQNTFAFLLIDGLSLKEEVVVSALHGGMRGINVFGGSAGDGQDFNKTYIYHGGAFHDDAAIVTLVQTTLPFTVFKTQHFEPGTAKMVITAADPERRIVTEINGVPAGREYARQVGIEVDELTPQIFATHPVVVCVGGAYYVRSIQKVNEDESLTFFCAIDEGIVLTVARGVDLLKNLESVFEEVREEVGVPQLTVGCDCILRHLEIGRENMTDRVFEVLEANNVIGFSTYGEQFNGMHVNQTFAGVAIGFREPHRLSNK